MTCPFCNVEGKKLYEIKRFSEHFSIEYCPACGLQFKVPNKEDDYYTQDYYEGKGEYFYIDERKYFPYFAYVWKARLDTIRKYKPPPARLLDVGCSFGGFVKTALHYQYIAEGIDVSYYATQEAKKDPVLKDKIFHSSLLEFTPPYRYDIITLIEVIEHLSSPVRVFEKLKDLLNPGGLLVIQTANMDGLQAKLAKDRYHYYLPGHLFYYSRKNLTMILKQFGFSKFIYFHGVDFGLLPKLKKMRGFFQSIRDYKKFFRVTLYHYLSKIAFGNFALTSSFVLYAFRNEYETRE